MDINRIAFTKGTIVVMIISVFLLAVYNQIKIRHLQSSLNNKASQIDSVKNNEDVEVVTEMGNILKFMEKSWFAKQANNAELTDFYVHEIEETFEKLEDLNIVDDGIEISKLVKDMAMPSLKELKASVQNPDTAVFNLKYKQMVNTCNACHQMSNKSFIRVAIPKVNQYSNQEFRKNN